jgi:hypothetical protein
VQRQIVHDAAVKDKNPTTSVRELGRAARGEDERESDAKRLESRERPLELLLIPASKGDTYQPECSRSTSRGHLDGEKGGRTHPSLSRRPSSLTALRPPGSSSIRFSLLAMAMVDGKREGWRRRKDTLALII